MGLVFIAIALQIPVLALLLLFTHAVSKALLSMSIGGVIASTNCQDITELGGLGSRMPATTTAFLVGGAGLVGFLPLGGFLALAQSIELLSVRSVPFMAVFLLTNALTAMCLVRVFRHVFMGNSLIKSPPGCRGELADGVPDGGAHRDRACLLYTSDAADEL